MNCGDHNLSKHHKADHVETHIVSPDYDQIVLAKSAFAQDWIAIVLSLSAGFVWDKDGHLVTSLHVVKGSSDVRVSFQTSVFNVSFFPAD